MPLEYCIIDKKTIKIKVSGKINSTPGSMYFSLEADKVYHMETGEYKARGLAEGKVNFDKLPEQFFMSYGIAFNWVDKKALFQGVDVEIGEEEFAKFIDFVKNSIGINEYQVK